MKLIRFSAFVFILLLMLCSCKHESNAAPIVPKEVSETATDSALGDSTTGTEPETEIGTDASPITSIKTEFARINAATLTKKRYTYECDALITIDYYYEGTQVVKAIVDYGTVGDHYQKSEFYYKNGKLIFFYDFIEGGPACEGCEMKLEQRYYVADDKVVKYIKNDSTTQCEICAFGKRSTPYRVLSAAATQDFKAAFCS